MSTMLIATGNLVRWILGVALVATSLLMSGALAAAQTASVPLLNPGARLNGSNDSFNCCSSSCLIITACLGRYVDFKICYPNWDNDQVNWTFEGSSQPSGSGTGATIHTRQWSWTGTHNVTASVPFPGTGGAVTVQVQIVTCTYTPICFGDGSGSPCACLNEGPSGGGCLNSLGLGGVLSASGSPATTSDTLTLTCTGVRSQPGLFFQGNNVIGGGAGTTFGDGIRCCGSNVVRIQVVIPPLPQPSTAETSVAITGQGPTGTIQPGETKCYQYWYRDPGGSPCGAYFNLSNGLQVTWAP